MSARLRDPEALERELGLAAGPEGMAWLEDALTEVAAQPAAIRMRFPSVGREVGREPLDPEADPEDVHAWTVDDAARTLLLTALGGAVADELADLYRFGDAPERRGLLRALPYLEIGADGIGLVDDAIRSNDTRLIAAALGPYATAYLDPDGYDQAVLKCVFVGVPITPLDGLEERATPEGARMLAAFVHERVAAGRDVPGEVWRVIDRFPPEAEIRAIEAELESRFADRRQAAEAALAAREDAFTTTEKEQR